jgi:aspartyl-tRNA(Asn)/glutamyl-tRNA(Gln) amidotransferase subunit C
LGRIGRIETLTPGRAVESSMSERAVDAEDVRHVADLARVELEDDEVEQFVGQFGDILEYFDSLDEVPETDREAELTNVLGPDETRESLSREDALSNAPESEDGYFKGPNVS